MIRQGYVLPGESGSTVVEFAVVAMLFFALVFGVLNFGWFVWTQQALTAAAREGARYGIATGTSTSTGLPHYLDCAGIRGAAIQFAPDMGIAPAEIQVRYLSANAADLQAGPKADCQPGGAPDPTAGTIAEGDRIVVEVVRPMQLPIPLLGDWTPTSSATAARSVFPVGS
jgi:hypothetical protein